MDNDTKTRITSSSSSINPLNASQVSTSSLPSNHGTTSRSRNEEKLHAYQEIFEYIRALSGLIIGPYITSDYENTLSFRFEQTANNYEDAIADYIQNDEEATLLTAWMTAHVEQMMVSSDELYAIDHDIDLEMGLDLTHDLCQVSGVTARAIRSLMEGPGWIEERRLRIKGFQVVENFTELGLTLRDWVNGMNEDSEDSEDSEDT